MENGLIRKKTIFIPLLPFLQDIQTTVHACSIDTVVSAYPSSNGTGCSRQVPQSTGSTFDDILGQQRVHAASIREQRKHMIVRQDAWRDESLHPAACTGVPDPWQYRSTGHYQALF